MSTPQTIPPTLGDDTARARRTDPETSHAAADSNTNRAEVEQFVLHLFDLYRYLTDQELTTLYFTEPSHPAAHDDSPRKRRSDLAKAGRLVQTTLPGKSRSGRAMTVWARPEDAKTDGVMKADIDG